jgi:hypothetical protein
VNAVTSADTQLNGTAGGFFGTVVAAGDINNDGRADIIASSINSVSVFHAGANGVASGNDTSAQTTITAEAGQSGLSFGGALAIDSINGTFFPALVIADAQYSLTPPSSTEGRIYVFQSATNGSGLPAGTVNGASADAIITGEASGDHFGTAVSVRDVSTDGFGDIIAGASVRNGSTGQAYEFGSATDGSGAADYDGTTAGTAPTQIPGFGTNTLFGGALAR